MPSPPAHASVFTDVPVVPELFGLACEETNDCGHSFLLNSEFFILHSFTFAPLMRIAIVLNTSWNIFNFRLNLLRAFAHEGHEIICIAPEDAYSQRLIDSGFEFYPVQMQNKGTNPAKDLALVQQFYKIYKQTRPDVVLHYTIKPNIYGTLAARLAGIPAINNVSGLGTVFIIKNFVSKVALGLYKLAFRFAGKVFFQNEDDRQLFLEHGLVKKAVTDVVPGSGIDTKRFKPVTPWVKHKPFTFLMVARLLYEKGVVEYLEAAREVKKRHPEVKFHLLGFLDEAGNIGIKRAKLQEWIAEGTVEYLGTSDDVGSIMAPVDCVVLPSYREGTPKTLLEAAAMGKPIITTSVAGCKETVVDGRNGYLCRERSATDLAAKMEQMLAQSDEALQAMGRASRQLAETKFDEKLVIDKYRAAIEEAVKK
jgi:glycosyltransferase involved in cell wall biosynthesis